MVINYGEGGGGATQTGGGGGASEFLPLQKKGRGRGRGHKFLVSFNKGALSMFYPVLRGGDNKFWTRDFHIL